MNGEPSVVTEGHVGITQPSLCERYFAQFADGRTALVAPLPMPHHGAHPGPDGLFVEVTISFAIVGWIEEERPAPLRWNIISPVREEDFEEHTDA